MAVPQGECFGLLGSSLFLLSFFSFSLFSFFFLFLFFSPPLLFSSTDFFLIIGPNGAGKTTTISMLTGSLSLSLFLSFSLSLPPFFLLSFSFLSFLNKTKIGLFPPTDGRARIGGYEVDLLSLLSLLSSLLSLLSSLLSLLPFDTHFL